MIVLTSYKVVLDGKKKPRFIDRRVVQTWVDEHDFGFNIFNPSEWRAYLRSYKTKSGKLLPRKAGVGERVVYRVHTFGTRGWMKERVPEAVLRSGQQLRILNLFPGYDSKGNSRLYLNDGEL